MLPPAPTWLAALLPSPEQLLPALVVGLLWGVTNPLVKRGAAIAEAKRAARPTSSSPSVLSDWALWLSTPQLVLPQALNQAGSVLFTILLGKSSTSISSLVPLSNALALISTAAVDLLLGERLELRLLVPGVLLVAAGVIVCGSASQPAQ